MQFALRDLQHGKQKEEGWNALCSICRIITTEAQQQVYEQQPIPDRAGFAGGFSGQLHCKPEAPAMGWNQLQNTGRPVSGALSL